MRMRSESFRFGLNAADIKIGAGGAPTPPADAPAEPPVDATAELPVESPTEPPTDAPAEPPVDAAVDTTTTDAGATTDVRFNSLKFSSRVLQIASCCS